jgi:acyl-CoA synthetase (AMP-forming)/AMP-acid ligase II
MQRVIIVDPECRLECAPGQVGEIWVSGPGVASGYWNRPEETRHAFQAYLADTGQGPFLRTGDLGAVHQGELYVTDRLKDLIIVAGRNHSPTGIEETVESSDPSVRQGCSAAFSVELDGEERLIVAAEVDRRTRRDGEAGAPSGPADLESGPVADLNTVSRQIRRAVADEHDLQIYAVVLLRRGALPKTPSGKVQRQACRQAFLANSFEPLEP